MRFVYSVFSSLSCFWTEINTNRLYRLSQSCKSDSRNYLLQLYKIWSGCVRCVCPNFLGFRAILVSRRQVVDWHAWIFGGGCVVLVGCQLEKDVTCGVFTILQLRYLMRTGHEFHDCAQPRSAHIVDFPLFVFENTCRELLSVSKSGWLLCVVLGFYGSILGVHRLACFGLLLLPVHFFYRYWWRSNVRWPFRSPLQTTTQLCRQRQNTRGCGLSIVYHRSREQFKIILILSLFCFNIHFSWLTLTFASAIKVWREIRSSLHPIQYTVFNQTGKTAVCSGGWMHSLCFEPIHRRGTGAWSSGGHPVDHFCVLYIACLLRHVSATVGHRQAQWQRNSRFSWAFPRSQDFLVIQLRCDRYQHRDEEGYIPPHELLQLPILQNTAVRCLILIFPDRMSCCLSNACLTNIVVADGSFWERLLFCFPTCLFCCWCRIPRRITLGAITGLERLDCFCQALRIKHARAREVRTRARNGPLIGYWSFTPEFPGLIGYWNITGMLNVSQLRRLPLLRRCPRENRRDRMDIW